MINREIDRELEVDVLALQALSSPSLRAELGALGGETCAVITVTCCNTCGQQTVCQDTVCVGKTL